MSIVMGVEYQGRNYKGWQFQSDVKTVQGSIEEAISKVANEKVGVVCAGRTDTGVHATSQVINFQSNAKRSIRQWQLGINSNLPEDIAVKWVVEQESNFNARFSANYRHYQYVLLTKSSILRTNNALFGNHMVSLESNLDVEKMHKDAQCLIGEHDFSAFRSSGCQAHSPVRRMYGLSVKRYSDFIVVDVMANAFLYNMVRNIVGALCEVGSGNKPKDWLKVILEGKNRDVGYKKMPAHGLYLVGVGYNDFPEVDRLSHYNKIMLTSGHLPLVFSDRLLKNKDKIIESV